MFPLELYKNIITNKQGVILKPTWSIKTNLPYKSFSESSVTAERMERGIIREFCVRLTAASVCFRLGLRRQGSGGNEKGKARHI